MGKRLFAMLLAVCLILGGLAGCAKQTPEDQAKDFVGTWAIDGVTKGGDEIVGDELDLYKAMGVYLIVGSDNTVLFEMFGMNVTGTYEVLETGVATVTFSESESADAGVSAKQTLEAKDGRLFLQDESDVMAFVQIDPSDKKSADVESLMEDVDDSTLEETLGVLRQDLASAADGTSPLQNAESVLEVIASDGACSIKVTAVGDYLGDPGCLLEIENKGNDRIVVEDDGAFVVAGTEADPVLLAVVEPGKTTSEVLWFERTSIGDVERLEDVQGKLVVKDYETDDEIGTYDFSL